MLLLFPTAGSQQGCESVNHIMLLSCSEPHQLSIPFRGKSKSQSLAMTHKALGDPRLFPNLSVHLVGLSCKCSRLFSSTPASLACLLFLKYPDLLPTSGLCTCYSFCLEILTPIPTSTRTSHIPFLFPSNHL